MDASKFMELFDSSPEECSDFESAKEALHDLLEGSDRSYYDVSGNGTQYYYSGNHHGAGFARCLLTLHPDGFATVRIDAMPVPHEHELTMRKLCRRWDSDFKLCGLKVEDGHIVFESEPFDPLGDMDCERAAGLAMSTIHAYASAVLALEAGAMPWDLIDLDRQGDRPGDGGAGDGGGGESEAPDLELFRTLLGDSARHASSTATA